MVEKGAHEKSLRLMACLCISIPTMLSGNPRIGRGMIVVAIFVVVVVLVTLAELRKKPVIQRQVPIHPSSLLVDSPMHGNELLEAESSLAVHYGSTAVRSAVTKNIAR